MKTKRIVVFDKHSKTLFVEDANEESLGKYPSLDDYVRDNYLVTDFLASDVTECQYIGPTDPEPYDLDQVLDGLDSE